MLDWKKMKLLLLLLLTLHSSAQAGWRDFVPTRNSLQEKYREAQGWILNHTSRETHLFLYANLPAIFPVTAVCQLRDGGVKKALLPGDSFQVQTQGADLECKEAFRASFRQGSAGRIEAKDGVIGLLLQQGAAELVSQTKKFSIGFAGYGLSIGANENGTHFSLRQTEQGALIVCNNGLAEAELSLEGSAGSAKKYVGTVNCRLGLSAGTFSGRRYLLARELIHPADLNVPRESLPVIDQIEMGRTFQFTPLDYGQANTIFLTRDPTPKPPSFVMLKIDRKEPRAANCSLYTQATNTAPLVLAQQFSLPASEKKSQLKLHADYRKYLISAVCSEAKGLAVSDVVGPDYDTIQK